jgi:hypothetical protein
MKEWTLEIADLFAPLGIRKTGQVTMNENTYDFDPQHPKDSWLYASLLGFQRLKEEGFTAERFATIGTGSGLDSIAVHELFHPKTIYQTDIHPNVIALADHNARSNIGNDTHLETFLGDLCEPLIERGIRVDLLYANLPNVPSNEPVLDKKVSASRFSAREGGDCPAELQRWLLTLQYLFLQQAKQVLKQNGVVVDAIGARIPYARMEEAFTANGYEVTELASVYKIQSEPEDALPGYVTAEKEHGIQFDFYDHERALPYWEQKLSAADLTTPELKEVLQPFHISATKALRMLEQEGKQSGHICSILKGTLKRS